MIMKILLLFNLLTITILSNDCEKAQKDWKIKYKYATVPNRTRLENVCASSNLCCNHKMKMEMVELVVSRMEHSILDLQYYQVINDNFAALLQFVIEDVDKLWSDLDRDYTKIYNYQYTSNRDLFQGFFDSLKSFFRERNSIKLIALDERDLHGLIDEFFKELKIRIIKLTEAQHSNTISNKDDLMCLTNHLNKIQALDDFVNKLIFNYFNYKLLMMAHKNLVNVMDDFQSNYLYENCVLPLVEGTYCQSFCSLQQPFCQDSCRKSLSNCFGSPIVKEWQTMLKSIKSFLTGYYNKMNLIAIHENFQFELSTVIKTIEEEYNKSRRKALKSCNIISRQRRNPYGNSHGSFNGLVTVNQPSVNQSRTARFELIMQNAMKDNHYIKSAIENIPQHLCNSAQLPKDCSIAIHQTRPSYSSANISSILSQGASILSSRDRMNRGYQRMYSDESYRLHDSQMQNQQPWSVPSNMDNNAKPMGNGNNRQAFPKPDSRAQGNSAGGNSYIDYGDYEDDYDYGGQGGLPTIQNSSFNPMANGFMPTGGINNVAQNPNPFIPQQPLSPPPPQPPHLSNNMNNMQPQQNIFQPRQQMRNNQNFGANPNQGYANHFNSNANQNQPVPQPNLNVPPSFLPQGNFGQQPYQPSPPMSGRGNNQEVAPPTYFRGSENNFPQNNFAPNPPAPRQQGASDYYNYGEDYYDYAEGGEPKKNSNPGNRQNPSGNLPRPIPNQSANQPLPSGNFHPQNPVNSGLENNQDMNHLMGSGDNSKQPFVNANENQPQPPPEMPDQVARLPDISVERKDPEPFARAEDEKFESNSENRSESSKEAPANKIPTPPKVAEDRQEADDTKKAQEEDKIDLTDPFSVPEEEPHVPEKAGENQPGWVVPPSQKEEEVVQTIPVVITTPAPVEETTTTTTTTTSTTTTTTSTTTPRPTPAATSTTTTTTERIILTPPKVIPRIKVPPNKVPPSPNSEPTVNNRPSAGTIRPPKYDFVPPPSPSKEPTPRQPNSNYPPNKNVESNFFQPPSPSAPSRPYEKDIGNHNQQLGFPSQPSHLGPNPGRPAAAPPPPPPPNPFPSNMGNNNQTGSAPYYDYEDYSDYDNLGGNAPPQGNMGGRLGNNNEVNNGGRFQPQQPSLPPSGPNGFNSVGNGNFPAQNFNSGGNGQLQPPNNRNPHNQYSYNNYKYDDDCDPNTDPDCGDYGYGEYEDGNNLASPPLDNNQKWNENNQMNNWPSSQDTGYNVLTITKAPSIISHHFLPDPPPEIWIPETMSLKGYQTGSINKSSSLHRFHLISLIPGYLAAFLLILQIL